MPRYRRSTGRSMTGTGCIPISVLVMTTIWYRPSSGGVPAGTSRVPVMLSTAQRRPRTNARLSRASHDGRNRRLQPLNPLQNPPRRDDDSSSEVLVTASIDLVHMLTRSGDPVDPTTAGSLATMARCPCTLADDGDMLPSSSPASSPSSFLRDAELDGTGTWGVPVKPFRSVASTISSASDTESSSSTTMSTCWSTVESV